MSRMVVAWLIMSVVAGLFAFALNRQEKRDVGSIIWRVVVSLLIGGVITAVLVALNNLQGL